MVGAIILAAGESRRMGEQKLLLPFGGRSVIEHVIEQVLASRVETAVVVLGHAPETVGEGLDAYPVSTTVNPDYRQGMLTSIRRGLAAAPDTWEAAFIVLGDQPSIRHDVLDGLMAFLESHDKTIAVPAFDGKRGHPLLVARAHFHAILERYDEVGLRGLLWEYPEAIGEMKVDTSRVLEDMDYPEDYQRQLRALEACRKRKERQS